MTTATHTPKTTAPHTPAGETGSADTSGHFRRLLGQRRLFGQLAECQRSHHGENTNTAMLDDVVDLLTSELDIRFPQQWRAVEPDLLIAELRLQHDPSDGAMAGCGLCHAATAATAQEHRGSHHRRPRPALARHQRTRPAATGAGADRGQDAA